LSTTLLTLDAAEHSAPERRNGHCVPVSVLIPVRNEAANLGRCLAPLLGWTDDVCVVDSWSSDGTAQIAHDAGARVVQFEYRGGWPKKRQWALDELPWKHEWVLILDADEVLTEELKREIADAIRSTRCNGYWLRFRVVFEGRLLRFGDTQLRKLYLFRRGRGRYERRLEEQDASMSDIEVHEHIVVDGPVDELRHPVRHENRNSMHRYLEKHNEYSTWEAHVLLHGDDGELPPRLLGNQAQRRRWLKRRLIGVPGSPLLRFLYVYVARLGFLDGRAGFVYAVMKGVQLFHVKVKMHELRRQGVPYAGPNL
jgi:glycosyltransferase involved in cell wall biosynthesis